MFCKLRLALSLLLAAFVAPLEAAEPVRSTGPEFTHTITKETPYYLTGPQQGRPPEGKFGEGTRVRLLHEAGSFSQVRSENGVTAFVASGAIRRGAASGGALLTADARRSPRRTICSLRIYMPG